MRYLLAAIMLPLLAAQISSAETLQVICGPSSGYSYYFQGGLVDEKRAGFTEDGVSAGKYTLVVNNKDGELSGDVLSLDATGRINGATAQGAAVMVSGSDQSMNWFVVYPDSTMENYAFSLGSSKVVSWRNTVSNENVAKNSLLVSSCLVE